MVVYLYSMGKLCSFCVKAEETFKNELKTGEMVLKSSNDKGAELYSGFPTFVNSSTGLSHSGLPKSKAALYEKLGVKDTPIPSCSIENMYIKGNLSGIPEYANGVWWCHKGENGVAGSVVFMTNDTLKKFYLVTTSNGNTPLNVYKSSLQDGSIINSFLSQYSSKLERYFPCTTQETWSNIDSVMALLFDTQDQMKTVDQIIDELIPSPCKNDKNLYCCEGTDGPSFFDIKTIIMLSVICLLFLAVLYLLMSK